jgi:hypothetical protein
VSRALTCGQITEAEREYSASGRLGGTTFSVAKPSADYVPPVEWGEVGILCSRE